MPESNKFKELRSRLRELRVNLLPKNFSPTGDYSKRHLDRARGYRLLAHAEIEAYMEDICRETVTIAVSRWKNDKKPSPVILALMAAYHSSWNAAEASQKEEIIRIAKSRKNISSSILDVIELAHLQFIQRVKDNHGIKDKNVKSMVLPTSIDIQDLDQTWLTNLDNFGRLRGEVAHKAIGAQGEINPQDEFNTVKNLLDGLKDLDVRLTLLRES